MIKIKSHDGPARLGTLDNITTPTLLSYKKIETIQDVPTPFKIHESIAKEYIEKTIELAENEDTNKIAIIQGAQYPELRINCAQKLEEIGYSTLMFANTDDLQRNPEKMLEIIIKTRENIKPTTALYFPFAITPLMPFLTYIGIDIFDTSRSIYEAKNNNLMTNTNIYPKEKYQISQNLTEDNIKQAEFTIKEIQENIKNKTLRNLTEQRATTSPEAMTTLRILDKKYPKYLDKYTPLH